MPLFTVRMSEGTSSDDGAKTAVGVIVAAVRLSHSRAHLAERTRDGRVVRVGEYLHDLKAAGAHESGAKRDLSANASTRITPNQHDFASVDHLGQRNGGGSDWLGGVEPPAQLPPQQVSLPFPIGLRWVPWKIAQLRP